jgi:murein DD-endopeptidase MepM/ murein hydrolase activator NlpD
MRTPRRIARTIFTPVTIMVVSHSRARTFGFRVPRIGLAVSLLAFSLGSAYILRSSVRTVEYDAMKTRLSLLTAEFHEMNAAMRSIRSAEGQFRKLFSLGSKTEVLEAFRTEDAGSLDMEELKKKIRETMDSVSGIRKYVAAQRDLYLATPAGWPSPGRISSGYGGRDHPSTGERKFHYGIDISVPSGTPVRATADGITVFSGWTEGSGYTVVIEHGHGFTTAYGHSEKNLVSAGRTVKRGEAIALSGSTGVSTGPHVHYEVWKNGQRVDPSAFLARR